MNSDPQYCDEDTGTITKMWRNITFHHAEKSDENPDYLVRIRIRPYLRIRIRVFPKTFGSGKQIKCWRSACLAAHPQQIDDVVMLTDHLQ
jgi:hypothetical protein